MLSNEIQVSISLDDTVLCVHIICLGTQDLRPEEVITEWHQMHHDVGGQEERTICRFLVVKNWISDVNAGKF